MREISYARDFLVIIIAMYFIENPREEYTSWSIVLTNIQTQISYGKRLIE